MTGPDDRYASDRVVEITADSLYDDDRWYSYVPWYRTTPAVLAGGAIAAGLVLLVVSSVLLFTHRPNDDQPQQTPWQTTGTPLDTPTLDAPPPPRTETPSPSSSPQPTETSAEAAPSAASSTDQTAAPEPPSAPTERRGAVGGRSGD